jgi:hypothetical protein
MEFYNKALHRFNELFRDKKDREAIRTIIDKVIIENSNKQVSLYKLIMKTIRSSSLDKFGETYDTIMQLLLN